MATLVIQAALFKKIKKPCQKEEVFRKTVAFFPSPLPSHYSKNNVSILTYQQLVEQLLYDCKILYLNSSSKFVLLN